VQHYLSQLAEPRLCNKSPQRGPRLAAFRRGGATFHILADDTAFALQPNIAPAGRAPLVAALFGQAPAPSGI